MTTPTNSGGPAVSEPQVFKPRSAAWFALGCWLVAIVGFVSAAFTHGVAGVLASWPLLGLAYLGWWLFWDPAVIILDAGVRLRNPVRQIFVPWNALIHVDTKYALTLITPHGSYQAWAAPAPGIFGTKRGKPENVLGLPASSYGPAQTVRPGDMTHTDSGQIAYLIRARWQELADTGALELGVADTVKTAATINWGPLLGAVVLLGGSVLYTVTR